MHRQGDSCHFKNICVQNSNVLFYLQTIGNNISLDVHKRFIHLEPGNVLPIHPFYSWRDSSKPSTETLQLQVLKTPIPSTAVWGESSVTAFAHSAWWHNIGHFIMDGMYPLFNLMRNFNMICRDLQIVSFPGPGECFDFATGDNSSDPLTKIAMGSFGSLTEARSTCLEKISELTCFKNVLVGTLFQGMNSQSGESRALSRHFLEFRDFIVSSHAIGLPVRTTLEEYQSRGQKIVRLTWLSKTNIRKVFNTDLLIQDIIRDQARSGITVECKVIVWEEVDTFQERVRIMDQTDILISFYGTAASFSMFLRSGSVFILIGGTSLGNEFDPIFSQYTHIKLVVYEPENCTDVFPPRNERTATWPDSGLVLSSEDFLPFTRTAFSRMLLSP